MFVSSVVEGFGEFRDAARRGILAAGADPVLVNEDFPALATSPRNACLDGVDSCDIYVCIIGERGGWQAPSGMLVTEEEYRRAQAAAMPVFLFLVEGDRDRAAEDLAKQMSDFVTGHYRIKVSACADLERRVCSALEGIIETMNLPTTPDSTINDAIQQRTSNQSDAVLRLVFAPDRCEEVIHPIRFGERAFVELLYRIGHEEQIRLFNYRHAKKDSTSASRLIIEQHTQSDHRSGREWVHLALDEGGVAVIDANVTGREPSGGVGVHPGSVIVVTAEIREVAAHAYAFYMGLFAELDPYQRHQLFRYNAALLGLDHRTIQETPSSGGSVPLRMARDNSPIVAFDSPRKLARQILAQPAEEIERMVTMLTRRSQL